MKKKWCGDQFRFGIIRRDARQDLIPRMHRSAREAGKIAFYEGTVEDITGPRLNEEKLVHLATMIPRPVAQPLLMNERAAAE